MLLGWILLGLVATIAAAAFWLHPAAGVLFLAVLLTAAAIARHARPAGRAGARLARGELPSGGTRKLGN